MKSLLFSYIFLSLFFYSANAQKTDSDSSGYKTVIAGAEYKASGWHKWLWGSNYRNVWTAPVTVRKLYMDTAMGGLTPVEEGGGNQTKTLHLTDNRGKEYSIRSVDKTLGKVLPPPFRKTFVEYKVNDEVSMSNPYGAAIVPYLAQNAGIYHTNPSYVYVPNQKALGKYDHNYGNEFYLFEQKVSGNWKESDALGNFTNYIETEEVLDTLNHCNTCFIDEKTFIRTRLFDMFINDWDRHEKQWSWGIKKDGSFTIIVPVPKDRDQAFSKHNGWLLNFGMKAGGLNYMQTFDDNLKNVKTFNYEQRNIDRRLLNEATLNDWLDAAKKLQRSLTDDVIEKSVQNLPKEIYPLVGKDIIEKLKARRNHLSEWATEYYNFISEEVQVPGTDKNEEFDIDRINNNEIQVQVFSLNEVNQKSNTPFYSRTFLFAETKEIRLFGLSGNDKYVISGNADNNIKVKIIGGPNQDSVINTSSTKNNNVLIYDNSNVITTGRAQINVCRDTMYRSYKYNWFRYDKSGFTPSVFYSNEDKLFVGFGYRTKHFKWDKMPYASNQSINYHYSLMDKSYSLTYRALFPGLIAHADLSLIANYDNIRWVHFFGLGNETQFPDNYNVQYFTMRTRQWTIEPGLSKRFGRSFVNVFAFANGLEIINDSSKFLNQTYKPTKSVYDWQTFAGGGISYSFQHFNDPIVPTSGIYFNATATGARDIKTSSKYYFNYSGTAHFYIPLVSKFSLNIRGGGSTVTGNPQFYQYTSIGGVLLRGFKRDRFWGKSAVWNTNDLRFISPVHTYFFNGKAGLQVFFDDGRVWMPGENSNLWHTAYGAGIILAPFNFIYADFNYGRSQNESSIQVRITYITK
ncbi:MAG: BamA/TamA family outer membrane protein [Parafilimonas sp.]|nr:BamA/TamA family outer membrane protein [Parafilimonas sp.]